jgi:N-hydroxyarylamine O-acetyltransferase
MPSDYVEIAVNDSPPVDKWLIDSYLSRLQLDREPPSPDALRRLHRAQVAKVPYETAWIHMGHLWTVDQHESFRRVASDRRGGYCFHLNGAFAVLLDALGYSVSLHVGGVHGPDGPDEAAMTNHLVLTVHGLADDSNPSGVWYVDAGLGDALYDVLPLIPGEHRQTPHTYSLSRSDSPVGDWHFHHDPSGSFAGMVFRQATTSIEAFAPRNTYLSTSPESGFVKTVTMQRRDATGIDILRGKVLRRVDGSGSTERTLATRDDWFDALREVFGVPLDDVDAADRDRLWRRVLATHEAWQATQ